LRYASTDIEKIAAMLRIHSQFSEILLNSLKSFSIIRNSSQSCLGTPIFGAGGSGENMNGQYHRPYLDEAN
jgi:hypothetical protein